MFILRLAEIGLERDAEKHVTHRPGPIAGERNQNWKPFLTFDSRRMHFTTHLGVWTYRKHMFVQQ